MIHSPETYVDDSSGLLYAHYLEACLVAKIAGSFLQRVVFIIGLIAFLFMMSLFVRREIEPRGIHKESELEPLETWPERKDLPPPEKPIRLEGRKDTRPR